MKKYIVWIVCLVFFISSCRDSAGDLQEIPYETTPYNVSSDITQNLGILPIPEDNPLTLEGIVLGQHLFYDPILSSTNTQSCSSCHDPHKAFTDGLKTSTGVQGLNGRRSSMSLVNSAYSTKGLFWDGRSEDLESQAILPVEDELELHHDWSEIEKDIRVHEDYPTMFRKAFGIKNSKEITRELAAKALAQFQRIILSGNSRFDRFLLGIGAMSDEAILGYQIFIDSFDAPIDAGCGHCHSGALLTTNQYFDNGIQMANSLAEYEDIGLGSVTNKNSDFGKFRAPTLRNIALTAPYMHDGRFETLEEVVEHYSTGVHRTPNLDPLIDDIPVLTEEYKEALVEFMKALTDTSFLENPYLLNPFE